MSKPSSTGTSEEPTNSGAIVQLLIVTAIIGIITTIFNYFMQKKKGKSKQKTESEEVLVDGENLSLDTKAVKTPPKKSAAKKSKSATAAKVGVLKFSHPDHAGTLKGHTSQVTDISFSSNGKYMASISADDRNVILWSTKELGADATRNMVRGKVDLDNPVSVDFSPDCKALALGLELTNSVKIMKIAKKEGTSTVTLTEGMEFPQVLDLDILTCAISPSGTYIMIADNKNSVYILDLKGIVLGKIDAKVGGDIHHCVVSPCGRFVAFCGYNPEMPIYEVEFSSTNVFRGLNRVMILKGHTNAITYFAFSLDAVSAATVSRDKTWRVSSIDVRYKDKEDPQFIASGDTGFDQGTDLKCLLSCNGKMIGIYSETEIKLKSVVTDETYVTYSDFGTGLAIRKCLTDNSSKHLLVCIGKYMVAIQVKYHIMSTIEWLKREVQKPNTASLKSRIQQQLDDEIKKLEAWEAKENPENEK
ncbi:transducin beta-like protein 2 [Symsagittifera roscoffensis]|uniref:transducin beta-like protein 2 n=1 Tax=Symsagittifera roscoffensis TaxID=84072 RepID=UPI00307C1CAF